MRILICSHLFDPSVGGVETLGRLLAEEFVRLGNDVTVATQTQGGDNKSSGFQIVRKPNLRKLYYLANSSDAILINNVSLGFTLPLILWRHRFVVAHHTWIARPDGTINWRDRIKQHTLRYGAGISISQAMRRHIEAPSQVIENCYDDRLFKSGPQNDTPRDVIFVGRLVSDKGVDLLLEALAQLAAQGSHLTLTVVGDGPERNSLERQAARLGLNSRVTFLGQMRHAELQKLYRAHRIAAFPSRWREPFGIVALEAAACGCVVIGSEGGGLHDAIGPCGETFPNGDSRALAATIAKYLADENPQSSLNRAAVERHLFAHSRSEVAKAYLEVLDRNRNTRSDGILVGSPGRNRL